MYAEESAFCYKDILKSLIEICKTGGQADLATEVESLKKDLQPPAAQA